MSRTKQTLLLLCTVFVCGFPGEATASPMAEGVEFFERSVRPLLATHCFECHSQRIAKPKGGLALDRRAAILRGGESGPAIVPGEPDESLMMRAVRWQALEMPPRGKLKPTEVAVLERWIALGAPWPDEDAASDGLPSQGYDWTSARAHWAFRSVERPAVPVVADDDWSRGPIDRFVAARRAAAGLSAAPRADRRTLIRRLSYDLLGLPPTAERVEAFVANDDPAAYEALVDELLASPHYGERWGRHWLDVARYSDTKGYVYAREEKNFVHAAGYRDWVVAALNDDLPYDRFLLLQLAADEVVPPHSPDLVAMGFLTLGQRFLGVPWDIVDDRIDVVTRGTMGLTVACARCHDHEYDPIPTADYYSLYGVFENAVERAVPVGPEPRPADLVALERTLNETIEARSREASERIRSRLADYLHAQRELEKYPPLGFDQIIAKEDLNPTIVRRFERSLATAADRRDPVFAHWIAYAALPDDGFAEAAERVTAELRSRPAGAVHPLVTRAFAEPPTSPREVSERYAELFGKVAMSETDDSADASADDSEDEALRRFLVGPDSPCVVPAEPLVNTEYLFDSDTMTALWKLQNAVDGWLLKARSTPHAVVLEERSHQVTPRILVRGNAARPGDAVPMRFLEVLSGPERRPFGRSPRLDLARAIVDPGNPLTARVWVNRVWRHHLGAGLVTTPSDFGLRADPPSHPELLDWLTSEFIASGWSTKELHRRIVLSATYRQSSAPPDSEETRRAARIDPANRLLWRMNVRRLGYEELRDTLLTTTGGLNSSMGGPTVDPLAGDPVQRRSLYGRIDRQFVPDVLRVFDFANPDLHSAARSETTVPQQALFAMNHPFVADRARALSALTTYGSVDERLTALFRRILQRGPSESERLASLGFVERAERAAIDRERSPAVLAWSYGFGELDESSGRLQAFHPLPHFTDSAWQGGPNWPDATLGWVRITAEGGHAGNDLAHAAVRRWTAPVDGVVSVTSTAEHDVDAGDGIRCRIVSSRHGLLASRTLRNQKQPLDVERIEVRAGDTLDFVVDYHANLNNDQFLWAPEIRLVGDEDSRWNAREHFAGPRTTMLTPWEQLAHVLLLSNELFFVD